MIDQRWIVQIHSSGREPMSFDVVRIVAIAVALIALVLLSGCRKDVRPVAVEEGCDALCRTTCETSVPIWNPPGGGASESDWDTYPEQVTIPLKGKADTCELHRVSCVQCLDRLKAAGATR